MKSRMVQSLMTLIGASLLFVGITLAWIISSQDSIIDPILIEVNPGDFEYSFYYFRSELFQGSGNSKLYDTLCINPEDQECFVEFDQTQPSLLSTNGSTRPSHQFSFALDVKNISNSNRGLVVLLTELLSSGYLLNSNQIQRAFSYQVTKIVYYTDVESEDIKDLLDVVYAGKETIPHFGLTPEAEYELLSDFVLTPSGPNQRMILYFTLRFDPEIKGLDEFGQSTNNSNAFQNQTFQIRKIKVEAVLPT